jgi:hypothetical protein
MKMLRAIAMAATVLGAAGAPPVGAQPVRPWCEYGAMGGSAPDCSYATFAQCQQTANGDGTCVRNPAFDWPYFRRGQPAPIDVDPYGRPLRPRRR